MEKIYKLIEDYLADQLSPEERLAFEERLTTDAKLAEAFQLQKSMDAFLVKENNKDQLIPQLEDLGKKHFEEADQEESGNADEVKVIPINRRRWLSGLAVAASIALLLFAINTLFKKSPYEQYALHQPINLVEKSDNNPDAVAAQNQFNNKDYQKAYESLTAYLRSSPEDTKAILAKGISALEIGRTEEAITIFNGIHTGATALKNSGTWYLALSYLKINDIEKAKTFLNLIPSSDAFFYKKEQSLLKLL